MSFRQHNKQPEVLWRKNHRDELLAAGLPEEVVDNERSWNYMLLHGEDLYQSGWEPSWITTHQAKKLLRLLRSQTFWTATGHEIFRELERKIETESNV